MESGGCSSNQTGTKDVIKCEDSEPALFEAPGILNDIYFFSANLGTQREDIESKKIRIRYRHFPIYFLNISTQRLGHDIAFTTKIPGLRCWSRKDVKMATFVRTATFVDGLATQQSTNWSFEAEPWHGIPGMFTAGVDVQILCFFRFDPSQSFPIPICYA